jgi:hypothetical protein
VKNYSRPQGFVDFYVLSILVMITAQNTQSIELKILIDLLNFKFRLINFILIVIIKYDLILIQK